jgi:hypothetical protein
MQAGAFTIFRASVRCWQQLWSRVWLTLGPFDQAATSRPGSGSCRSSTRAGARTGSAVSANRETAICAACSSLAHSQSFAMPRSIGRSGGQDNPLVPSHCRMRVVDRDLIRGGHYGQRSCAPHLKAEHMAAPTKPATCRFFLPTWSRPYMAHRDATDGGPIRRDWV